MQDKTKDIKPDYDNEDIVNEGPIITDKYISFMHTDHEHPYNDPFVLKIEDIFGFMMTYRKPYSKNDRKSLKNYRNKLTKHCRNCMRFPSICHESRFKKRDDICRVLYLKEAMTREIRGLKVRVKGGTVKIEIQ